MSAQVRLVTFNAQNVTPQDDGLLYETAIPDSGVIYGCGLSASGNNTIHLDAGFGIVRGRFFEVEESTLSVPLSSTGEIQGRVIGRLDLSNTDSPFEILAQTGSLSPLRQDADVNIFNGVHEFLLATFTVDEVSILNFGDVKHTVQNVDLSAYALKTELDLYALKTDLNVYAKTSDLTAYAKIASPTFTGTPQAPTPTNIKTNSDQIATMKWVQAIYSGYHNLELYPANLTPTAVPNATNTEFETPAVTCEAGTMHFFGAVYVNFGTAATGRRSVNVYSRRNGSLGGINAEAVLPAEFSGGNKVITVPFVCDLVTGDSIVVRLWQNSGGSITPTRIQVRAIGIYKGM